MFSRFSTLLVATTALVPLGLAIAVANPQGPQVVGGSATVQGQGTSPVTVTQQTNSAIINWNTFNIGTLEKTNIFQPSASSVELDRVTGGLGPSQVLGSLWSNGRVFLVNPDGILFGPGAKIDTGSFLATTHDIANSDFMAGRYNFSIPGNPTASIVNQGTITAQSGGFAALVAPGVRNSGTITAKLGTIALASGNAFTLDFYGDKLITLGVSDSIAATVQDVATGQPLSSLVKNDGKLKANGGTVELTAVAARQVVDSVINNTGVIEANTIGTHNGMIVLGAATAASKPAAAPTQTVKVSGTLSTAGKKKGTIGGTIEVTGEAIALYGATLDASGVAGGGTVLVGGDWSGGNPTIQVTNPSAVLQPYAVPTATSVLFDPTSIVDVSATISGNGGKAIVWADQTTSFSGTIFARGGPLGGDGGFVETSGHVLDFVGARVDTSAPYGWTGSWLLDPYDLTIDSSAAATIAASLATTNVTIQTTASGSSGPGISNPSGNGDIFVNSGISWGSANSLTLSAYRNIAINAALTGTSGVLTLGAVGSISATAAVNVGTFTLQSGSWNQNTTNLPSFTARDF
jgi:filamentous hemagglutinin family protein